MRRLRERLRAQWFLLALAAALLLAKAAPALGAHGGPLKPEITVKILAVGAIFLVSGLSLRRRDLSEAVFQWKVHLVIQGFTLLAVPMFAQLMAPVVAFVFHDPNLVKGLVTLSCMPPPVSSAVILTKAAGGNEAAAIFNSALGSIIGVLVTPAMLLLLVGESTPLPLTSIFTQLGLTVALPLLLGQILQGLLQDTGWIGQRQQARLGLVSQLSLLLIIYTTFCDAFSAGGGSDEVDTTEFLSVIFIVILFQMSAMAFLFKLTASSLKQHFNPKDSVCIVFCGVHKSLTLGIPMLRILYESSPHLSSLCLPLLVYHPTQILLGGILVPYVKSYLKRRTSGYNLGVRI